MSLANYIILCDGRINVAVAKNGMEMIQAASRTAKELTTHYGDNLTMVDTLPISDLQHQMMDLLNARKEVRNAGEMVDEMFALLEALEKKMNYEK